MVYGHGMDGISVSVDGRELRHALSGGSGTNQLLELKIGSESHLAMARMLQRHPVRHTVVHVDFQIVSRDEVISAEVPVVLIGEARTVEREGGMLEQPLATVTVNATPSRIPVHIELDITELNVGEAIRIGDLKLPVGVTTDLSEDEIVVIASHSRVQAEAAETGSGEAGGAEGGSAGGAQAGSSEEG